MRPGVMSYVKDSLSFSDGSWATVAWLGMGLGSLWSGVSSVEQGFKWHVTTKCSDALGPGPGAWSSVVGIGYTRCER